MARLVVAASVASVALGVFAIAALAALTASGCTQRARMCSAPTECGANAGCVAGRCLPDGGMPAIQNARRLVLDPVDVAYVRRGEGASGGELPAIFTLGRGADGEALLFLRFLVPIAKDAKILEAYLLLERTDAVDSDPTPITLHASRIVDPWDGRSISWARQPRLEETRSPSTTIDPSGRMLIRLDVRELVKRWRLHEKSEQGIAVVADNASATGMAFALTVAQEAQAVAAEPAPTEPHPGPQRSGPRLELYVK
jgi:hypothetical protein